MKLASKADTLVKLQGRLKSAKSLPLVCFSVADWKKSAQTQVNQIKSQLGFDAPLIVRSSAASEDKSTYSNAGAYLSVPNVQSEAELTEAIEQVIASYDANDDVKDQLFVQPWLQDVKLAGVALTRDPSTGSNYYIINYDESGKTCGVTGGPLAVELKTHISNKSSPCTFDATITQILALAKELETLFASDSLDIEFAIDKNDVLYLFQVRLLVVAKDKVKSSSEQQILLKQAQEKIAQAMHPHPYLNGTKTAYGVMPDWNPAEIIGLRPRPLSLSLYRDLVTDSIWAYQRSNYGYKNLRSFPLMVNFSGLPYIDLRVSLNSFIPQEINSSLADRLANYYLDRLLTAPSLHDKVEFEIVFSCYTLDLPTRLEVLKEHGFGEEDIHELTESLRRLTNSIICRDGLWTIDCDKVSSLTARQQGIMDADMDPVQRIYWLLEDCKRYGTLPFAGLARAAFMAIQMIHSMIALGVFSTAEASAFLSGINTVTSQITNDFAHIDKDTFLTKYGHLRPGTYDILSPRYDEAPDLYFDWNAAKQAERKSEEFSLSLKQIKEMNKLLEAHGLENDAVGLFDFIAAAIEWREQSKFIFTRSLSDAIKLFHHYGESLGFSADDLSYANINVIAELNASSMNAKEVIAGSIAQGRKLHAESLQLILPPLIIKPDDVWGFYMPDTEPNYITQKIISAKAITSAQKEDLKNAIVLIESADPGFDWIFLHSIVGLVTAYGGMNSHMAIRAGEMGIPAVIGVGEMLFKKYSDADTLKLDCANRRIEVLKWRSF